VICFVFVDGVGAGARDPAVNPLARGDYLLARFADGGGSPLPAGGAGGLADACLGVPGRPQSATGHTTILTGLNAPAALGRHQLGFPGRELRGLLDAGGVFGDVVRAGRRAAYANAYRCAYLDALGLPHACPTGFAEPPLPVKAARLRPAATTYAAARAGLEFRTFDHLRRGEALYHDVTSEAARAVGCDVPRREPEEAAEVLLGLGRGADLVMFEHFRTDEAGHARDFGLAAAVLDGLDRFLRAAIRGLRAGDGLLVASDHGNLEDLGTRRHTLNPVPILGFGTAAAAVAGIRSLLDLHPALLRLATGDAA
jgi:hypothetical protein